MEINEKLAEANQEIGKLKYIINSRNATTEEFCKLIGKMQFLCELDLGSITRNETASEVLKEVIEIKNKLDLNI
tara:strand:+ start:1319 stop:1540 length:222 start_codon:yes stop_codon:yes gene_type:complete